MGHVAPAADGMPLRRSAALSRQRDGRRARRPGRPRETQQRMSHRPAIRRGEAAGQRRCWARRPQRGAQPTAKAPNQAHGRQRGTPDAARSGKMPSTRRRIRPGTPTRAPGAVRGLWCRSPCLFLRPLPGRALARIPPRAQLQVGYAARGEWAPGVLSGQAADPIRRPRSRHPRLPLDACYSV